MKNNPFTRFLSVALTAVMLVGVMPGAVLADAGEAIVGASSAVVESIPESTTPADAAPVATEVPPVTEPEATPETTQEPEATPEATEQPEATPEATQEPEATPEATEQPEATPEATQEPEATPEATEQPEATPEATQEPEATPEATEQPEATPEATEEPETSPEPTEEPVELNEEEYTVTADVTGAQGVTVTVKVPANTLPEGVNLVAEMLAEDTQAHADAEAALADAEVQYDGMIAMDIRFEDAEGNEVEPANEVEVSIDAQALLPEDADPETVAVQHLKEDETGAVAVETVANTDAATGDITVAENADQAALNMASTFAVDGFSIFTITWGDHSVSVSFVDENGNALYSGNVDFSDLSGKYSPTDFGDKFIADQWVSVEQLAATWASKTEGFSYVEAYTSSSWGGKVSVNWIYFSTSRRGWYYSSSEQAPSQAPGWNSSTFNNLKLVYEEVTEIVPDENLQIQDDVSNTGELVAQYNQSGTYYYVWEKSESGQSWNKISRRKVNEDDYNVTKTGDRLNVALEVVDDDRDDGGWWYRVSVYESQQSYQNGQSPWATSAPMQLEYYDTLRNGSFEAPVVSDLSAGHKSNYQYPVGTKDLIWKTTGSDQQIEIVDTTAPSVSSDYNGLNSAASGIQCAELNCEAYGALYQDVLTVPGTTLNWALSHRARKGQDKMALVIMSANEADQLAADLQEIAANSDLTSTQKAAQIEKKLDTAKYAGAFVEYIEDDQNWSTYRGTYTVSGDQYLTRFFFVAVSTGSDVDTVGNFLDNVWFTTDLIPNDGFANLTITKTVEGLSAQVMKNYTVSVQVSGDNINKTIVLGSEQAPFTAKGDHYVASYTIQDIAIPANGSKTIMVTEQSSFEDIGDYKYLGSSVSVNGGASAQTTTASITLKELDAGKVDFTNTYAVTSGSMTITKTFQMPDGTSLNPPDDLSYIELKLKQYYYVTVDGDKEKQYVGGDPDTHVITASLTKQSDGKFEGELTEDILYYTDFEFISETLYKQNGTEIANAADWESSFTIDRGYLNVNVSANVQTATEDNSFLLYGTGYILAKVNTGGNSWDLCMLHQPAEADKSAVLNKIVAAANSSKGANVKPEDVSWRTVEDMVGHGATIVFQQDGNVTLDFENSSRWAQFYYGVFDYSNYSLEATLCNTLDKDAVTSISVEKVWEDNDNATGSRPTSITVRLMDGDKKVSETTLTATDGWRGKFANLPKYAANGELINYSTYTVVDEEENYEDSCKFENGKFVITNTLAKGTLTITKELLSFNPSMGDDATFQFKITHTATDRVWYRYVTFEENGDQIITMENMPAGAYTIEELDSAGYKLQVGCEKKQNTTVSVTAPGSAEFINESTGGNTPGDQDIVRNNFRYDADRECWIFEQQQEQQQP